MTPPRTKGGETAAGFGGGTPAAVILVWWLNSFVLPAPMPGEIAVAIGSVVTTATALIYRAIVRRMK